MRMDQGLKNGKAAIYGNGGEGRGGPYRIHRTKVHLKCRGDMLPRGAIDGVLLNH